jgi:hypothetical protein
MEGIPVVCPSQLLAAIFGSPHDNPPRWVVMFTAYLDECGQESRGIVRVGGFIGRDSQWTKLAAEWPKGFEGSQRKSLHMADLRFKREADKYLLARLGPIPESCGLRRIVGSVDVNDYYDLVEGTVGEVHAQGYAVAMWPLIDAIKDVIPSTESYKLVFEEQQALGFYRDKWLDLIAYIQSHPPAGRRVTKRPKLIGWETIVKGESYLCEPADYLCYHLAHKADDPDSLRALWTAPIMGEGGSIWKRHLSRERIRWYFNELPRLGKESPEGLAKWKNELRTGGFDPWAKLLESDPLGRE